MTTPHTKYAETKNHHPEDGNQRADVARLADGSAEPIFRKYRQETDKRYYGKNKEYKDPCAACELVRGKHVRAREAKHCCQCPRKERGFLCILCAEVRDHALTDTRTHVEGC